MAMTESMEEMKMEQSTERMIKAYLKEKLKREKREKRKEELKKKRVRVKREADGKLRRLTSRSLAREASEIEHELDKETSIQQKRAKNLLQNAWNDSAIDALIDFKGMEAKEKVHVATGTTE